jgi:hypothetical protein
MKWSTHSFNEVVNPMKWSTHSFILLNWQFPLVVGQTESLTCKLHHSSKTHEPELHEKYKTMG